jgi:hypothetical protein
MVVMPGLDPGIHVLLARESEYVDGRVKPGHDEMDRHSGFDASHRPGMTVPTA